MAWPYSFPKTSTDFKNAVPTATGSTCDNFVTAIIRLPLLIYQFISTMIDVNGNLTQTFLSMLYSPGDLKMSASTAPASTQWLLCDGREVARTQYPDLFAQIGTTFGAPGNPANFKLPNFSGRFPVCAGGFPSGASVALAGSGGEDLHVLTVPEMAKHTHAFQPKENSNSETGAGKYTTGNDTTEGQLNSYDTAEAGGDVGHNTLPPYLGIYILIFAGVPTS